MRKNTRLSGTNEQMVTGRRLCITVSKLNIVKINLTLKGLGLLTFSVSFQRIQIEAILKF